MTFDFIWFMHLFPIVLSALGLTIEMSVLSLVFTLLLSVLVAMIRYYKVRGLFQLCGIYITVFRATPLVAQLFILYFGFPALIPAMKAMSAVQTTILALTLNTAAFMAETLRASIESVEKGQFEACYAMGMTKRQTMLRVILPQAFVVALPMLGNQFIGIVKGTALGFTIGLPDIMAKAKIEASLDLRFFEAYLCVTLIYLVLVICIEKIQGEIEKRLQKFG